VARSTVDSDSRKPDIFGRVFWLASAKLACTPARQTTSAAAGVRSVAVRPSTWSSGAKPWWQWEQW
jgi:hypothetical protein